MRPAALQGVLIVIASGALQACTGARPPPSVSFGDVGLFAPPPAPPPRRPVSRLGSATTALVDAIERETGARPVFDAERDGGAMTIDASMREVRRASRGWLEERTALAAELIRTLDAGDGTTVTVRRARAALTWERLLAAKGSEVDRFLVDEALRRADDALPPPPKVATAPEEPELAWPLDPVRVTSTFGIRADPLGEGNQRHLGIDLAAVEGQLVRAASDGVVVFAGKRGGYGLHVEVRHGSALVTRYAHLSELDVQAGERVGLGAPLGRAGRTGRATGPHLHFEVWRDGLPIDPRDLLPANVRFSSVR